MPLGGEWLPIVLSPRGRVSGSEAASASVGKWLGCPNSAIIAMSEGAHARPYKGLNTNSIPAAPVRIRRMWRV